MEEKSCVWCGRKKQIKEFSRDKRKKDGYQSYCSECRKEGRRKSKQEKLGDPRESWHLTTTKKCNTCHEEKTLDLYSYKKKENNFLNRCKKCEAERRKNLRHENKLKIEKEGI